LDLPPEVRWREFAQKYRSLIIEKATHMGRLYEVGIGPNATARWLKAAPVDEVLMAEYKGIASTVNSSDVTVDRLILTDMWQAVDAPTFECTGLLAAMANGTVIHGRNIDYDTAMMLKQALAANVSLAGGAQFDGTFVRGGKPIVSFLAQIGSLGIHTGMRLGSWSFNSNARIFNNKMMDNLRATEAGAQNFPWFARKVLEQVPDFESAVKAWETVDLNAPNYFILAGSEPYQGAVITRDRMGNHEASTPPTQRLSAEEGIWHLVQTNDDLLSPPLDARREAALTRLSVSLPSQVDEDFVQHEMLSSPVFNSDTLITWVANPRAGTHRVFPRDLGESTRGLISKLIHKALRLPMPQDLGYDPAKDVPLAMVAKRSSLRTRQKSLRAA